MGGLTGPLACLLALGAIGTSRQGLPAAAGLPSFDHVFVLVMENHDSGQLVGDTGVVALAGAGRVGDAGRDRQP